MQEPSNTKLAIARAYLADGTEEGQKKCEKFLNAQGFARSSWELFKLTHGRLLNPFRAIHAGVLSYEPQTRESVNQKSSHYIINGLAKIYDPIATVSAIGAAALALTTNPLGWSVLSAATLATGVYGAYHLGGYAHQVAKSAANRVSKWWNKENNPQEDEERNLLDETGASAKKEEVAPKPNPTSLEASSVRIADPSLSSLKGPPTITAKDFETTSQPRLEEKLTISPNNSPTPPVTLTKSISISETESGSLPRSTTFLDGPPIITAADSKTNQKLTDTEPTAENLLTLSPSSTQTQPTTQTRRVSISETNSSSLPRSTTLTGQTFSQTATTASNLTTLPSSSSSTSLSSQHPKQPSLSSLTTIDAPRPQSSSSITTIDLKTTTSSAITTLEPTSSSLSSDSKRASTLSTLPSSTMTPPSPKDGATFRTTPAKVEVPKSRTFPSTGKETSASALPASASFVTVNPMKSAESLQLMGVIGEGASGKVYKARYNGKLVAAKEFIAKAENTAIVREQRNEINKMLEMVSSPYILKPEGIVQTHDKVYVLTPYHTSGDLHHLDKTALNTRQLLAIAQKISEGLADLHGNGILHRDLKGLNIFVDEDESCDQSADNRYNVVIGDPGLNVSLSSVLSEQKERFGTAQWMAPELLQKQKQNATTKTDVYSLGMIFYELLTGSAPYNGVSDLDAAIKKGRSAYPGLEVLFDLMKDCCKREPKHRPPIEQINQRLKSALGIKQEEVSKLDLVPEKKHKKITRRETATAQAQKQSVISKNFIMAGKEHQRVTQPVIEHGQHGLYQGSLVSVTSQRILERRFPAKDWPGLERQGHNIRSKEAINSRSNIAKVLFVKKRGIMDQLRGKESDKIVALVEDFPLGTLHHLLANNKNISYKQLYPILSGVVNALLAFHDKANPIPHGGIHTANVLLTGENEKMSCKTINFPLVMPAVKDAKPALDAAKHWQVDSATFAELQHQTNQVPSLKGDIHDFGNLLFKVIAYINNPENSFHSKDKEYLAGLTQLARDCVQVKLEIFQVNDRLKMLQPKNEVTLSPTVTTRSIAAGPSTLTPSSPPLSTLSTPKSPGIVTLSSPKSPLLTMPGPGSMVTTQPQTPRITTQTTKPNVVVSSSSSLASLSKQEVGKKPNSLFNSLRSLSLFNSLRGKSPSGSTITPTTTLPRSPSR